MPAKTQDLLDAQTIEQEFTLDPALILAANPEPEEETPDTRRTAEQLAEMGFDKGAIIAMAGLGLVRDDELTTEGKPAERKAPYWIVPETLEDVQRILQAREIREKRKADRVKQHGRWLRKENRGLDFIDKVVEPLCVEVTRKHLPLGMDGKPKQQFVELDEKRLQLRTQGETVKMIDPEAVIRQMEAWERELAELDAQLCAAENTEEAKRHLIDRCAQLEPDLAELAAAFRLTITTKEEFAGDAIAEEFPESERSEGARPFRVTVLTREDYLGEPGWKVYGEHPEAGPGEEYSTVVEASAVEAFVSAHPPVTICDAAGEVLEEYPFELPGVVRRPAVTTIFAG